MASFGRFRNVATAVSKKMVDSTTKWGMKREKKNFGMDRVTQPRNTGPIHRKAVLPLCISEEYQRLSRQLTFDIFQTKV